MIISIFAFQIITLFVVIWILLNQINPPKKSD